MCARAHRVKPPFQQDQIFLADVQRALDANGRALWWLGQSGFLVVEHGQGLLFDPYLSDSLTRKYALTDKPHTRITGRVIDPAALGKLGVINVITSSHNHTDHLDAETLTPLLAGNARRGWSFHLQIAILFSIAWPGGGLPPDRAGRRRLSQGWGSRNSRRRLCHPTVERDALDRCCFLGYIVRWNELTFYHSGDTLWHEGLVPSLKRFKIDIAFLPINGDRPERRVAGNLDGPQAAQLAKAIGARWVVPCHFDLFEFNTASPDDFISECERIGQPYRVLRNGEGWKI